MQVPSSESYWNLYRIRSGLPCLFLSPMSGPDEDIIAFLTKMLVFSEKMEYKVLRCVSVTFR